MFGSKQKDLNFTEIVLLKMSSLTHPQVIAKLFDFCASTHEGGPYDRCTAPCLMKTYKTFLVNNKVVIH